MTKKILTIFFVLMAGFVIGFVAGWSAAQKEAPQMEQDTPTTAPFDTLSEWQALTLAIAITESKCNPSATGASQDVGVLQLRPIYVAEANRVGGTNYAHSDAYDPLKSLLMFRAVQDYHNPEHDQNKAIKLHNKAPWYAQRVKDNLEFVQRYEAVRSLL